MTDSVISTYLSSILVSKLSILEFWMVPNKNRKNYSCFWTWLARKFEVHNNNKNFVSIWKSNKGNLHAPHCMVIELLFNHTTTDSLSQHEAWSNCYTQEAAPVSDNILMYRTVPCTMVLLSAHAMLLYINKASIIERPDQKKLCDQSKPQSTPGTNWYLNTRRASHRDKSHLESSRNRRFMNILKKYA